MTFVEAPPNPVVAPARDMHRMGVHLVGDGVDIAVVATRASRVDVCFLHDGFEVNHTLAGPNLGIWHGHVPGVTASTRYGFRVWGRWDPAAGLRHNPAKLLLDPYARAIEGELSHGAEVYDYVWEGGRPGTPHLASPLDSAHHVPHGVVVDSPFSAYSSRPRRAWDDTVVYEAHVRGLTMLLPDMPEHLRGTYAGLAHPYTISHLKRLGVTALELLPIHAKAPEPALVQRGFQNYWGYNTLAFFAPEPTYATAGSQAAGGAAVLAEFKGMVHLLHEAGIEVILDVVYNHTAEGGTDGPTLSLRGLDNPTYYLMDEADQYLDYTGCGNTVDFRHTRAVQLTLDSLRYWVSEVGIDGFRFDLAVTLGRHKEHFTPYHAFLVAMTTDPVLRDTKLISEPWDLGPHGWRTGQFPAPMADWNDRYRNSLRTFWLSDAAAQSKGHPGQSPADLGYRLAGSADLFGHGEVPGGRSPLASVNFVTAHDGFTLRDLTSYDRKHNEANGEDNRDGSNDNHSWNHGSEGPASSEDLNGVILALRRRSMRNLLGSLLISAGTPMLVAGDEIGRTQRGNNNAYCQDNEISWVDWELEPWQESLFATVAQLIRLRREHPSLRPARFATGRPLPGDTIPDLAWYGADGQPKPAHAWHDPHQRLIQLLRSGHPHGRDSLVVVNGQLDPVDVTIPTGRGHNYTLVWDSERENPPRVPDTVAPGEVVTVEALSMQVYLATAT
ncbi:MAG: glycogen debranching protein GlgX [Actinomycetota bacterium]